MGEGVGVLVEIREERMRQTERERERERDRQTDRQTDRERGGVDKRGGGGEGEKKGHLWSLAEA